MYFTPLSVLEAMGIMATDGVLSNPPFTTLQRGDRVRVDYSARQWPDNVVYPHGRCGYVQEVFGPRCAVQMDGQPDRCEWVDAKYLTVIVTEAEASERTAP